MRLYPFSILLAATLALSPSLHADTFTTTISGPGLTLVFPGFGGPLSYTLNRISTIQAGNLPVSVNGVSTYMGFPTVGELVFTVMPSPTSYQDLRTLIPGIPSLTLYGPNLVGSMNGFYSFPGIYNLADANGVPYPYVVVDNSLPVATTPEPTTLTLLATSLLGAAIRLRKRRSA